MASQNILVNTTPSTGIMSLSSNGSIVIFVGGYLGWGFDINITSTSATGTISIYTQYTNPVGDTFVGTYVSQYTVASGTFPNSLTRQTIDSNNVTTKGYVIIQWTGSDASNGNIAIVGLQNIF